MEPFDRLRASFWNDWNTLTNWNGWNQFIRRRKAISQPVGAKFISCMDLELHAFERPRLNNRQETFGNSKTSVLCQHEPPVPRATYRRPC